MNMHENFSTEITSHYRNPVLSQMYNCHTKTTIDMSTLCVFGPLYVMVFMFTR